MSLAATRRRGWLLNCRFAVNGIQKASRLFGTPGSGESSVSYMSGSWNGSREAADLSTRAADDGRRALVAVQQKARLASPPGEDGRSRVVPHRTDDGAGDAGQPPCLVGMEDVG